MEAPHQRHLHPLPASNPFSAFVKRIDNFVFPPLCFVCDQTRPEDDRWLCQTCKSTLTQQMTQRICCPRCSQNPAIRACTCTIVWDFPFSCIHSFLDYHDTVQAIMHGIKYKGMRDLAFYLGRLCAESGSGKELFEEGAVMVPIPLHPKRLRKRGYNQAEWFARGLQSIYSACTVQTDILQRVKNTRTQTSFDRSDRRQNVEGVFSLTYGAARKITRRKVIILDDVVTTGATTAAAAQALQDAQCADIAIVSLCRD